MVYPVKMGYLVISGKTRSTTDAGESGLYYYGLDDKLTKIISGLISYVAISSDGCKAAFPHVKTHSEGTKAKRTLKILDLC